MQPNDLFTFLQFSTQERLQAVAEGRFADVLTEYFGAHAYQDYLGIAVKTVQKLQDRHLGPTPPENLIFIPGVMGSLLYSEKYGGVWWIDIRTRKHIDDLRLDPDGDLDAHADNQIRPFTVDTLYEPFLAAILRTSTFRHVVFSYDWRKSPLKSAPRLRDRILQLYEENGNKKIHLVAHSMGGLTVRSTLMLYGHELWDKLDRIVFIGTPHYGSPAIASYLKNHLWGFDLIELLGRFYLSRETFRSLWGVLSMLPAPRGIYPDTRTDKIAKDEAVHDLYVHPCANFDMYSADAWKLDLGNSERPLGLSSNQLDQLQRKLDATKALYKQMYEAHWDLDRSYRHRMAVIAGVGVKTLYRLEFKKGFWGIWEHTEKIFESLDGNPHRQGDGRVPIASAALEDVGSVRYVRGEHSNLPMMPVVYEDIFRWLNHEEMKLSRTVSEALATHLAPNRESNEAPHLTSPFARETLNKPIDYWELVAPPTEVLKGLDEKLKSGQLTDFIKVRLL